MHDLIAAAGDPVWREWYPPNGHNCRCRVIALTRRRAERLASQTDQDLSQPARNRMPTVNGRPARPDEGWQELPRVFLREAAGKRPSGRDIDRERLGELARRLERDLESPKMSDDKNRGGKKL